MIHDRRTPACDLTFYAKDSQPCPRCRYYFCQLHSSAPCEQGHVHQVRARNVPFTTLQAAELAADAIMLLADLQPAAQLSPKLIDLPYGHESGHVSPPPLAAYPFTDPKKTDTGFQPCGILASADNDGGVSSQPIDAWDYWYVLPEAVLPQSADFNAARTLQLHKALFERTLRFERSVFIDPRWYAFHYSLRKLGNSEFADFIGPLLRSDHAGIFCPITEPYLRTMAKIQHSWWTYRCKIAAVRVVEPPQPDAKVVEPLVPTLSEYYHLLANTMTTLQTQVWQRINRYPLRAFEVDHHFWFFVNPWHLIISHRNSGLWGGYFRTLSNLHFMNTAFPQTYLAFQTILRRLHHWEFTPIAEFTPPRLEGMRQDIHALGRCYQAIHDAYSAQLQLFAEPPLATAFQATLKTLAAAGMQLWQERVEEYVSPP